MNERPEVSVIIITYNHERWIAQAIESVLTQQADFAFELLISEDFSTDRTRSIIQEYQKRHPDRIRLFLSEQNLCDNTVLTRAWEAAGGRFIAVFDGDDYWTSPDKLQRQRDHLVRTPSQSACFHNAVVLWESGRVEQTLFNPPNQSHEIGESDIWKFCMVAACTIMYRGGVVAKLPTWYRSANAGDWPLHVMHAAKGDIGYIPDAMAAYRKHPRGFWSSLDMIEQCNMSIQTLREMRRGFGSQYYQLADAGIARVRVNLALEYERRGQNIRTWGCLLMSMGEAFTNPHLEMKWIAGRVLQMKFPRLLRAARAFWR